MFASGSQLAQARPSDSTATTAFTASIPTEITRIVVCNTTGSSAAYSVFHDDDGSTYDEGTALFYGVALAANSSDVIDFGGMGGGIQVRKGGAIGVKTGTGSAITFTLYGITSNVR